MLRGSVLAPIVSGSAASRLVRLVPRLLGQLVPAALVATIGVALLSSLAKAPSAAPDAVPVATAIITEAVFKITPREPPAADREDVQPVQAVHAVIKPKPPAANAAPLRTAVNEPPRQMVSAPLPIAPVVPPQITAEAPNSEGVVMGTLRGATATVQRIPQWAARSMSGWFAEGAPPRPPAPVPVPMDFQASM